MYLGGDAAEYDVWACVSRQDAVLTAVSAWEAQNLQALREQEAGALRELEQEQLLTYTREDAYNSVSTCHVSPRCRAGSGPQGTVVENRCPVFQFHMSFPW